MTKDLMLPLDSKKCCPATAGGISREPEKDGMVKKVCDIITEKPQKS